jgi:hypothetical protein
MSPTINKNILISTDEINIIKFLEKCKNTKFLESIYFEELI